jgi:hypothetical protein
VPAPAARSSSGCPARPAGVRAAGSLRRSRPGRRSRAIAWPRRYGRRSRRQAARPAPERAVASPRKEHLFNEVLLACALADKDPLGRFPAVNVPDPLKRITGKDYGTGAFQSHLAKFCEPYRGPVLKKSGTVRSYRWQFVNPQLIPFIHLEGIRTELIPEN